MAQKDPGAVRLGKKGGKARWAGVSDAEREAHAHMMVRARRKKAKRARRP